MDATLNRMSKRISFVRFDILLLLDMELWTCKIVFLMLCLAFRSKRKKKCSKKKNFTTFFEVLKRDY